MKNLIYLFLLLANLVYANDGAYYVHGNHLIPMYETDISVTKEILTMQKLGNDMIKINVYYEFYNPKSPKTIEVGFEANSPSGDVDGTPIKGRHPNISEFTVNLNGQSLPFLVAIVSDSLYYKNGKFIEKSLEDALKSIENANEVNFNYVYHFKANFKQGLNTLTHTYIFQLARSVETEYELSYVLTAAKRWANKQIDDFTLKIDMGSFADFHIENTFFDNISEWKIEGMGKKEYITKDRQDTHLLALNTAHFWVKEGLISFQKKNFAPQGEFNLYAIHFFFTNPFHAKDALPFQIGAIEEHLNEAENEVSLKILRNLPFARRGYIFKTPEIQAYYEKMPWYVSNPTYQADLSKLTRTEQEWLKKLKLLH